MTTDGNKEIEANSIIVIVQRDWDQTTTLGVFRAVDYIADLDAIIAGARLTRREFDNDAAVIKNLIERGFITPVDACELSLAAVRSPETGYLENCGEILRLNGAWGRRGDGE